MRGGLTYSTVVGSNSSHNKHEDEGGDDLEQERLCITADRKSSTLICCRIQNEAQSKC